MFKLNNGVMMPELGIGTYLISPADAEICVEKGIKMGYRLVDTANAYGNEKAVGRAIKNSGVDRDKMFISSKIWVTEYTNPHAVEDTLERLGLDYIDLLFIHQPSEGYMQAYKQIEKAVKEGKVRAIGISNCEGKYIHNIIDNCEILPQVIQVEAHPYFTQDDLRKTLEKYNICLMSWYPLGHGDKSLINEQVFKKLADKYHKTPIQIILRWHIDMGFCVIPGSSNPLHVQENFDILDFKLSDEDMKEIAKINKNKRYYVRTDEMLKHFLSFKPNYEK